MRLNYFLVFLPIALALRWFEADPLLIFVASALAVMPLSEQMGDATEVLARYLGPTKGSLLNASLNNAPEIIIALFALKNGLVDVVKASLTGSIMGNLLFGLGLAMLTGGLKHRIQNFDPKGAGMNGNLLTLASFGLIIPAVFHAGTDAVSWEISQEISVVLLLVYLASLVFVLLAPKTTQPTTLGEARDEDEARGNKLPQSLPQARGWKGALGLLAAVTLGLAIMSEVMTDALEPTAVKLGLTPVFAGIILLAMVSNIPQFFNAVSFARANQMDLAIGVTLGASTQVALLVAPLLVLCSPLLGHPMDLQFTQFEIVAVALAVFVARILTTDGQSNWLEGLMLLAVYLMLGFAFYVLPAAV
ncbi:MAG: calcium/proton exchanger [Planctomycetaceae bacterium]|nr:calcium/proton exchanger [Planctomycetaceae bacterium]